VDIMAKNSVRIGGVVLLLSCVSSLSAQVVERVSVDSQNTQVSLGGTLPLSKRVTDAEARYVVFASDADDLVANDLNGQRDVFLRDRLLGTTVRISVNKDDGGDANGESDNPAISGNGRFISFASTADDLVEGDSNGLYDVFLYDRFDDEMTRVSVASGGGDPNGTSNRPSISYDGRYVTFSSQATNLVAAGANINVDIYLFDVFLGETTKVTVRPGGAWTELNSWQPVISADGRHVAFTSGDGGLVAGDVNSPQDVFVCDLDTGTIERVSVSTAGGEGTDRNGVASISGNGSVVAWWSRATELVADDTNGQDDIFVRDRTAGTTTRVNVSSAGEQPTGGGSWHVSISDDGRFVAYTSSALNLVDDDANGAGDIFSYDRSTGITRRHSVTMDGVEGLDYSNAASLSPDGAYVVFRSGASNLVDNDTNSAEDVFIAWGPATVFCDGFESGSLTIWSLSGG
jgi:Tol biopolymer transport system component